MMSESAHVQSRVAPSRGEGTRFEQHPLDDAAILEALDGACREAASHDWKSAVGRTGDADEAAKALREAIAAYVVARRRAGALPEQVLLLVREEVAARLRRHGYRRDLYTLHDFVFAAFLSAYFDKASRA